MNFNTQENIYLGISRKADGPMKGRLENQNLFFNGQGLNDKILVLAGLAHGNKVFKVEKSNSNVIIPDCDALISNQDNFLLAITVADCLPIYFYDNNKKVVAIAHAGWLK